LIRLGEDLAGRPDFSTPAACKCRGAFWLCGPGGRLAFADPYTDGERTVFCFSLRTNMRIVRYPHPSLRHPGKPVTQIDKQLRLQIGTMFDLMYDAKGVGLAATQVALPYQLVVMNITADPEKKDEERVYINPVLVQKKGIIDDEEGCLSFPGLWARVKRAKQAVVEAYDLKGEKVRLEVEGYEARAWQHEIDHLNGVVFIDRFSPVARLSHHRDVKAFERQFRRAQETGELPPDLEIEKLLRALEEQMEATPSQPATPTIG
jgi:peptide deformylase